MSLYKTQRCRHFDEAGNPIKPYCSQGNKCRRVTYSRDGVSTLGSTLSRFIHPNDHQWAKLKRRSDDTPSPEHRGVARSKGKNKLQLSPGSPPPRQRSSPLMPQTDLFKRKQKDTTRDHDHGDWSVRNGDRRRDSDSWVYARERGCLWETRYPQKRANDEGDLYPNQRPRLSERSLHGSAPTSGYNNTRYTAESNKIGCPVPHISERDSKATTKVSDTFCRLAKLCCEIVQDTCLLDREEDKLTAFTGLSSELSRAVPDAAMAVTPALATVITGHSRTRERLENHVDELETLWKTLFSILEADICKVIDTRLEQAMSLLDKERDNALRVITRSQRLIDDGGWKETVTDRATTASERGAISVNGGSMANYPPEETRTKGGSTSLSLVPAHEGDFGTSLRIVLEDMKMQMDRQTRAIELLAQENLQLRTATERDPSQPVVPLDSTSSSSPRKSSIL